MIGVENLIVKLNTLINSGGLTELEITQLSAAVDSIENYGVSSVLNSNNLPNPVTNKGRFFWIENESRYTFSNGVSWNINSILDTTGIKLYSWGNNFNGQLGDGTAVMKSSPVSVLGGFTDWVQVGAGGNFSVGLRANGTAWSWGNNTFLRLGNGSFSGLAISSPVSVVGGFTDWVQLHAGFATVTGLRANGTIWGWGENYSGNLGDGSAFDRESPVSLLGGFTDWIQVSGSSGIRSNGTAWGWGTNTGGSIGNNSTASVFSPVSVVGGFTDWIQISKAATHTLALRANGTAWAWGNGLNGKLGDGTIVGKSSPVSVVGGFADWTQLVAGISHSIGIRANGTAWAWGNNTNGQLGTGDTTSRSSPVSVVGGFTDWVQADTGYGHTVALRANGTAWAWGINIEGRLGDNTTTNKSSPISVVGGFTDWVQITSYSISNLALRG